MKLCVVVNEFGEADVDGNILREANAELLTSITPSQQYQSVLLKEKRIVF